LPHRLQSNQYQSSETLKPEFRDSIVGMGGTLTHVWEEQRAPFKKKRSSSRIEDYTPQYQPEAGNQAVVRATGG
jgi:hypothetical protein